MLMHVFIMLPQAVAFAIKQLIMTNILTLTPCLSCHVSMYRQCMTAATEGGRIMRAPKQITSTRSGL